MHIQRRWLPLEATSRDRVSAGSDSQTSSHHLPNRSSVLGKPEEEVPTENRLIYYVSEEIDKFWNPVVQTGLDQGRTDTCFLWPLCKDEMATKTDSISTAHSIAGVDVARSRKESQFHAVREFMLSGVGRITCM